MKLSTQTNFYVKNFGYISGIEKLCKIGYDALDLTLWHLGKSTDDVLLGDDYKSEALKIKETAKKHGVHFNQCHAPYDFADRSFFTNEKARQDMLFRLRRSIEIAGIIGAEFVIIHPLHGSRYIAKSAAEILNLNTVFYGELVDCAKKAGVKIAVENMWRRNAANNSIIQDTCSNPHEFAQYIDTLNAKHSDIFAACLDIGHCILTGVAAEDCIKTLGHRLKALHVHDNDSIKDSHTLPFTGKIDFSAITAALKEIGYSGYFTFEADKFLSGFPLDFADNAARFMHDTGRYLINMIK